MKHLISKKDKTLKGEINLDGSKNITNRIFIIKALTSGYFDVKNYSNSEDSQTLFGLINSEEKVLDAKDGGSTLRFLLAFLAMHEGELILTCSDRLLDRPIDPLVNALRSLGADIQYLGKKNYPPLLIRGKMLKGNRVDIDATVSSHFVTALLLIAPVLRNGLIMRIKGSDSVSRPYIETTLHILKHFGIRYDWSQNMISLGRQDYEPRNYTVEGDWSSAASFYQMAALADEVDLKLNNLSRISMQGDSAIAKIMEQFGVMTTFTDNGAHLTKKNSIRPRVFEYNFQNCPDLAPAMLATCAAMNLQAKITGLAQYKNRENDRIAVMHHELGRIGAEIQRDDLRVMLSFSGGANLTDITFKTHSDHRIAMALAPLTMMKGEMLIDNPSAVNKSYPSFWQQLSQVGFELEPAGEMVYS